MDAVHDVLIRKLKEHTALSSNEISALRSLPAHVRVIAAGEDIVRQGDNPNVSVVVLAGMVGRYHTLSSGRRQYLAFHITGDMPDAQALFIEQIDHAVCAIGQATIALIPHGKLLALFDRLPSTGFAIWRETLIDAAIFREVITNNGSRGITVRLAHFLCEQFYRAQAAGVAEGNSCALPLNQTQIAEALGSSLTTINRSMQSLRKKGWADFKAGRLLIRNWSRFAEFGDFNPAYLHLRRPLRS
jgi:CRP-like cAMP-binding protein